MKTLYRFLHRLRTDEKRSPVIFWSVLAFSFLLGILFTYLYGNLSETLRNRDTDAPFKYRLYEVYYGTYDRLSYIPGPSLPEEGIQAVIDSDLFETVELVAVSDQGIRIGTVVKGQGYGVGMFDPVWGETDPSRLRSGEVIAATSQVPEPGAELVMGQKRYRVVGALKNDGDTYTITYEDYKQAGLSTQFIGAYAAALEDLGGEEDFLTRSEAGRLIVASFPEIDGTVPHISAPSRAVERSNTNTAHQKLCAVFAFSLLAAMVMIGYMVDRTSYDYAVERIVGVPRCKILATVMGEFFVLNAFPSFLGVLFHCAFQEQIFSSLNLSQEGTASLIYRPGLLRYTGMDYMHILVLIFLLELAAALLFLARYLCVTPREMKRRAL